MYKINDIVLVNSPAGPAIPAVHVKLVKQIIVEKSKYSEGYKGWEAVLIYKEEVEMLRKRWCIPYKFPDKVQTFVYEHNIIKKVRISKNRRKQIR